MVSGKGYFDSVLGNCMLMSKLSGVVSEIKYKTELYNLYLVQHRSLTEVFGCRETVTKEFLFASSVFSGSKLTIYKKKK